VKVLPPATGIGIGCGIGEFNFESAYSKALDMSYREHNPPCPRLVGYDPFYDLPMDHLARLVEEVVEESLELPAKSAGPGQPGFDPRLCAKVLVYGYATGVRSSRQLEKLCDESLPYLFLTRGDTPSYRTLCSVRVEQAEILERVWVGLFSVARECGMHRLGRIVVDSSKLRANTGSESVLERDEYAEMKSALKSILAEAEGNTLTFRGRKKMRGDEVKVYQASRGCRLCPRYSECISSKNAKAKYKQLIVRDGCEELVAARDKFNDPEHRQRYRDRGSERVKCEGSLMRLGYQVRKVHQRSRRRQVFG